MSTPMVTLRPVGNWQGQTRSGLEAKMGLFMNVMNKTGAEACATGLLYMAQSAGVLTKKSKKNRKIQKDKNGQYVDVWIQQQPQPIKLYKWMFGDPSATAPYIRRSRLRGTWEKGRHIRNQGLAKRSWLWGVEKIATRKYRGATRASREIARASRVYSILSVGECGYVKENRLKYITKIMPAGWETIVVEKVESRFLKVAARKMEREAAAAAKREVRETARVLRSFFKAVT